MANDIDAIVRELREAHAAYPHGLHTGEGCLYVEMDRVGIISHGGDDNVHWGPDDVRLAVRLVRCANHMPAILDALAAARKERDAAMKVVLAANTNDVHWASPLGCAIGNLRVAFPHLFNASPQADPLVAEVERREKA